MIARKTPIAVAILALLPRASLASPTSTTSVERDVTNTSEFTPTSRVSMRVDLKSALDTGFDREEEHVAEFAMAARLELDLELSRGLSVFVLPKFEFVSAFDRHANDRYATTFLPPEASILYATGPFVLRLGSLVFAWGSSELIAPSDVMNPLDVRHVPMGMMQDAKIPVIAAELMAHVPPISVRLAVAPFFSPSRFFLSGWDFAFDRVAEAADVPILDIDRLIDPAALDLSGDALLVNRRPSESPANATLGARATLEFAHTDVSLTFVHGWDPIPRITTHRSLLELGRKIRDRQPNENLLEDPAVIVSLDRLRDAMRAGHPIFEGRYTRRTLAGVDAMVALDPFILKLDVAHSLERTFMTSDFRFLGLPSLDAVVGGEYIYGEELQVMVELFCLTAFGVGSDARLLFLEAASADVARSERVASRTVFFPGVAWGIAWRVFSSDLRFEIGGAASFGRGDLFVAPALHYALDDANRLSLGGLLIEGPSDGYGGVYGSNDQVYIQYRWSR